MRGIPLITIALALAALANTLFFGSGFNVALPARFWGGPAAAVAGKAQGVRRMDAQPFERQ